MSVFDGDPEPLYRLINDAEADDAARDTAFAAWTYWAASGGITEQEARDRLSQWLDTLEPRSDSLVWSGWIEAVAVLGFEDMADTVQAIIDENFMPERMMVFSDFERMIEESRTDRAAFMVRRRLEPFSDVIGTLSQWHGFSDAYIRKQRRGEMELAMATRIENPLRHIGRNDPCPCGSGKKFKKCCLH